MTIQRIIEEIDLDHDNTIDYHEFEIMMKKMEQDNSMDGLDMEERKSKFAINS